MPTIDPVYCEFFLLPLQKIAERATEGAGNPLPLEYLPTARVGTGNVDNSNVLGKLNKNKNLIIIMYDSRIIALS